MRMNCGTTTDQLLRWIDGETNQDLSDHVASCELCKAEIKRYETLIQRLAIPFAPVPNAVIERAIQIFPARKRFSLVRSTFALGGTRKQAPNHVQALFEMEDQSVRVMASRKGGVWTVQASVPEGATVTHETAKVAQSEFGVEFSVSLLEDSAFKLTMDGETFEVPAIQDSTREPE